MRERLCFPWGHVATSKPSSLFRESKRDGRDKGTEMGRDGAKTCGIPKLFLLVPAPDAPRPSHATGNECADEAHPQYCAHTHAKIGTNILFVGTTCNGHYLWAAP
jgi:hypothetical protein